VEPDVAKIAGHYHRVVAPSLYPRKTDGLERCHHEIARTVSVSLSTVGRTKRRFVEGNLERALSEEPRPGAERKLTDKEEALPVATACAKPPAGCKRWTLTLLADTMVKLTDHNSPSGETVSRRLAENDLKPWRRTCGAFPMSTANTLPAWRTCSTSTP